MSNPLVIRVTRPYASTDEFLANEAWTLQTKAILLVGEPERPAGTLIRFEVVLETGEKVMRGEGASGRYVPSMGPRPGGLEVRFKRLDAASKALIDRALRTRPRRRSESTASLAAVELSPLPPTAVSDAAALETPPSDRTPLTTPPPGLAGAAVELNLAGVEPAAAVSEGDVAASPQPPPERPPNSRSGTRRRVIKEVAAPPNRDSLLERLRERARALRKG